ncbi:diversity-generating retroelement protein Avd [Vibrio sp. ZSDZ34]|uniref:Diversity-generating retroelement protein Avd n=1 Tax=Vibrio gelatinilyticus TaxID=2893468 RepID=A0A9X2AV08_9VIBR|nr:diversity-generating retroelement protein Avd [Vibrio gelatinilyticus]MCJ2375656.1 diversity-generating retroelement protein Avd [Vibrio gelatinilyticus]
MTMNKPGSIAVVENCHQYLIWLIPKLDQFPKNRRFSLGEKIERCALALLSCLVEAGYATTRHKLQWLDKANRNLNLLRHLWRLSFELKVINIKSYETGSQYVVDIGNQVGGWRKGASQN